MSPHKGIHRSYNSNFHVLTSCAILAHDLLMPNIHIDLSLIRHLYVHMFDLHVITPIKVNITILCTDFMCNVKLHSLDIL